MSDMNNVHLIGRLTRDAELTYTSTGTAICKFSLAVNDTYMKDGQKQQNVSFFNVVLWGKRGEALTQYLLKGKQVGIEGKLKQERWQDKEGKSRQNVNIVCNQLQLLGGAGQSGSSNKPEAAPAPKDDFEDDIPF